MDKSRDIYLKKVLTFKSGNFVFSRKYSNKKIANLLLEAQILHKTVIDLPILPALSSNLEDEIIRRSIFGTAAIEGNSLTEEKVGEIITNKSFKKNQRAEIEIINLKSVYDFIQTLQGDDKKPHILINEDLINKIHKIITENIEHKYNIPGRYRSHLVEVGNNDHGGVYKPPKILEDIKTLMKEFIEWINSKEILADDPIVRACITHYHLALIHPFGDGNGRTARVIEAFLLQKAGIKYAPPMLSNYYYRNIDDYFWAFSNSIKNKENNITPFLEFYLKGLIESLNEIKKRIIFFIRIITLRDFYDHLKKDKRISSRQNDLLLMLLDNLKSFTLEDLSKVSPFNILFRKVSVRTIRRDLKKLHDEKFLIIKNGKYELNLNILD